MTIFNVFYTVMSSLGFTAKKDEKKHTPPSSGTTLSAPIPNGILAFRTITLILSQILNMLPPINTHKITPEESREVRIADAFAHIAVANHDIIAITTQRGPVVLNVVAVTESINEDKGETSIPDTSVVQEPETMVGQILGYIGFVCLKNAWKNEPDPNMKNGSPFPVVVSPTNLIIGDTPLEDYLCELRGKW